MGKIYNCYTKQHLLNAVANNPGLVKAYSAIFESLLIVPSLMAQSIYPSLKGFVFTRSISGSGKQRVLRRILNTLILSKVRRPHLPIGFACR